MAETSKIEFASLEPTLLDRILTRTYGTVYPTADQVTAINTFTTKINSMYAHTTSHANLRFKWKTSVNSTVWLGGTFTTSVFTAIQYNSSTDYIPCVSPIGNSGNGSELISIITGLYKRKKLSEIIYIEIAGTKYNKENALQKFTLKILEKIRFAPSASNKQEWRIVISENKMHFFGIKGSWTALDMGICTAHAQVALAGNKVEGKFEIEKPEICVPGD
ncbi:hypothetical protein EIN_285470 [Entamoeba invadens IP1]|uniref:Putative nitroreductase TM1586 domain-containing protein n=1 Tax=Entamoeba invadens IP1 TaxID=370355 RepID=A0A0A1U8D9_ENTIV|nr:hypothetical protein EIN_285470 [Entamoeba invadens IP1]ELP89321.1 hypothetical protein EIN_285470 [Entamoeba invadens IP1]|eukprot:XP_004256092.1 hypothetical protein EIN_285470 [Entamoeba invadens IP1]